MLSKMSSCQIKGMRHVKKQESMAHTGGGEGSIETVPEGAQMLDLFHKDFIQILHSKN